MQRRFLLFTLLLLLSSFLFAKKHFAFIDYAGKGGFKIYANGYIISSFEDSVRHSHQHYIPRQYLDKQNVIAVVLNTDSYAAVTEMSFYCEVTIRDSDKTSTEDLVWVYCTTKGKQPPVDAQGKNWKEQNYKPDTAKGWSDSPAVFKGKVGGTKMRPFVSCNKRGQSGTVDDVYYFRIPFEVSDKTLEQADKWKGSARGDREKKRVGEFRIAGTERANAGNYEGALICFLLSDEMVPGDPEVLKSAAGCFIMLGDKRRGRKLYEQALELNPDDKELRKYLETLD